MSFHHPDELIYKDSPFVTPIEIGSTAIVNMRVHTFGMAPLVAISIEISHLANLQGGLIDDNIAWIEEKFGVNADDINDFFLGLITPPTLITGADMLHTQSLDSTLGVLFPAGGDETQFALRTYSQRHLLPTRRILDQTWANPIAAVDPIYNHCKLEVFSEGFWYAVGLASGKHVFDSFAPLIGD